MPTRREILLAPAALAATGAAAAAADGPMTLALHHNTSSAAGYRASLEGWARAGIRQVEIANNLLDAFLKTETLATARRVLTDHGLTPVSASCGVGGLIEPNPDRAAAFDRLKRRCEMLATLGLTRTYATTATTATPTADDYTAAADHMRVAGDIAAQFRLTMMFEFVRQSTFAATLPTLLTIVRAAAHPSTGVLFDCYHFWSGHNRLEDLDQLRPGDIKHVHFQDVADLPREMLDLTTRVMPGDGVTPLVAILRALAAKAAYTGPLSVELFSRPFQIRDPYEIAREIVPKAEAVMRQAGVL
ncbi:MAG: sugar phosphate isomerase/epimerase family protein [Vicinamibacterales bacterium]